MSDQPDTTPHRARFARLYGDGGMIIMPAGMDFAAARKEMCGEDPNVEMLEVEVSVIRTHGHPHIREVTDRHVTCPTCGEEIYVEETADGEIVT